MPLIATSYEGFVLGMQIPFSFVSALVAAWYAFKSETRFQSAGFAILAMLITLGGIVLEVKEYGLRSLTHQIGTVLVALLPSIIAVLVLVFGATKPHQKE